MGWRWSAIVSEAAANVGGRASRLRISVIFAILAGTGLTVAAAADWAGLRSEISALERQGWTTLIVSVNETGAINAETCRAAGTLPGVKSAAALLETGVERFVQLGARSVPTAVVATTDPIPAFTYDAQLPILPGWVGSGLVADTAGLVRLDRRSTTLLPIEVVGPLPDYLDLADLSNSIVVAVPFRSGAAPTRSCVFHISPSRADELRSEIPASLEATTIGLTVRRPGSVVVANHPYEDFLQRPQRLTAMLVGALGGLIATITSRSRNGELGVYRVSGLTRLQVMALQGAEQTMIAGVWLTAAAVSTVFGSSLIDLPLASSLSFQAHGVAVMAIVSLIGLGLASSRPVTQLLKDQ